MIFLLTFRKHFVLKKLVNALSMNKMPNFLQKKFYAVVAGVILPYNHFQPLSKNMQQNTFLDVNYKNIQKKEQPLVFSNLEIS